MIFELTMIQKEILVHLHGISKYQNDVVRFFLDKSSKDKLKDDIKYLKDYGFVEDEKKEFKHIKLTPISNDLCKLYEKIYKCVKCEKFVYRKQLHGHGNVCMSCINGMGNKRCSKCKEIKNKSEFYRDGNKFTPRCKNCRQIDRKEYVEQNKELVKQKYKEINARRKEYTKNYKKKHPSKKLTDQQKRRKKLLLKIHEESTK